MSRTLPRLGDEDGLDDNEAETIDWPGLLAALVAGADLTREQAAWAMADILAGTAEPSRIAGLIVGLAAKGESIEELAGMAMAMRAAREPIQVDPGVIDIVGTGGSAHRRLHALNVSTMASIVAASAGAVVCKHGNRRASSTSGSFDFLEALGVAIDLGPRALEACVAEIGLGFAFARAHHPALRFAGPVRAELGIPTAFNLLGPLAHPGLVTRQVVGVASPERAELLAGVLQELGSTAAWVVSGHGGLDELSLTGDSQVWRVTSAGVERSTVELGPLGLTPVSSAELAGGDPATNAGIFERLVNGDRNSGSMGEPGSPIEDPIRDIVVLNAAAGLVVAGVADSLADGMEQAAAALDDGRSAAKLAELRAVTNRLAGQP